jgi:hypothetical protein
MKTTIIALLALSSVTALAHTIRGTAVLRGKAEGLAWVNGVQIECVVKLDKKKITNLLDEDRYGNPAYQVEAEISLVSKDRRALPLRERHEVRFINMHTDAEGKIVRDEAYFAPTDRRFNFTIDANGRFKVLYAPSAVGNVVCRF